MYGYSPTEIWNVQTKTCVLTLGELSGGTTATELKNGKIVIGTSSGNTLIWNLQQDDYQCTGNINGSVNKIIELVDGSIVVAADNISIIAYDANEEEYYIVQTLTDCLSTVYELKELKDKSFASVSMDKKIRIWKQNINDRKFYCITALHADDHSVINSFIEMKNGCLATITYSGIIRIWG